MAIQIVDNIKQLLIDVNLAMAKLNVGVNQKKLIDLEALTCQNDFWQDHKAASDILKKIVDTKAQINPWLDLKNKIEVTLELAELGDETLETDLNKQYCLLKTEYERLKVALMYGGKYDSYDAIINIYAGAGGTDAQDWAEMLMRMYIRWAEMTSGIVVKIIDQSVGEEAGIKGVTLEMNGKLAYGRLKGEQGVHRLVRLSPFNADHLRQTSFAKVEVMPKIIQPEEAAIDDKDLKIDVFRAGGHGGQSVNTTDSAVRITHIPTGITVTIQNERSQLQNKDTALTILRSKLVQLQLEQHKEKIEELKGPNEQAAWGNQVRNYVLHPYSMVKDLRSKFETSDTQAILDGKIDGFMNAYLEWNIAGEEQK